ncbi:hypothetical protein ACHAXN_006668 [Cyclotella atomus]
MSDEEKQVDQYSSALHEFCGFEGVGGLIVSNDSSDEDEPPSKENANEPDHVAALDQVFDGEVAAEKEDDDAAAAAPPDEFDAFRDFDGVATIEDTVFSDANFDAFDSAPLQNEPDEFGNNFSPENNNLVQMDTGAIEHEGFVSSESNEELVGQETNEDVSQINIDNVHQNSMACVTGENYSHELKTSSIGDAPDEFDAFGDFNAIAVTHDTPADANFGAFDSASLQIERDGAAMNSTLGNAASNAADTFCSFDDLNGMDLQNNNGANAVDANINADAASVNVDPNEVKQTDHVSETFQEDHRDEDACDTGELMTFDQKDEALEANNTVLDSPGTVHSQETTVSSGRPSAFDATDADAKLVKTTTDEVVTEETIDGFTFTFYDVISSEATHNVAFAEGDVFAAELASEMTNTTVLAEDADQVVYTEEEKTSSCESMPLDTLASKQQSSSKQDVDDMDVVPDSSMVPTENFELANEEPAGSEVHNADAEGEDVIVSFNTEQLTASDDDFGGFASFEEHGGNCAENEHEPADFEGDGFVELGHQEEKPVEVLDSRLQTATSTQPHQTPNRGSSAEAEDDNFGDFGDFEEVPAQESDLNETNFEGFASFKDAAPSDAADVEFASFEDVQTQQSDVLPNHQEPATATSSDEDDFSFGEFEEISAPADAQESECETRLRSFPVVLHENVRVMLQTLFKDVCKDHSSEDNETPPHYVTLLSVIPNESVKNECATENFKYSEDGLIAIEHFLKDLPVSPPSSILSRGENWSPYRQYYFGKDGSTFAVNREPLSVEVPEVLCIDLPTGFDARELSKPPSENVSVAQMKLTSAEVPIEDFPVVNKINSEFDDSQLSSTGKKFFDNIPDLSYMLLSTLSLEK